MKYIFLILIVALFACRKKSEDCPNNPQFQTLTASAKEWFPYSTNTPLIFENNTLQKDTLQLTAYFAGEGDIWVGDKCPITRGQFLRGNIIDTKTSDTIKLQIGYTDEVRMVTNKTNMLYYDTRNIIVKASAYKRFETRLSLIDKVYTNVLVLECAAEDNCDTKAITKVYLSKTKGLVGYVRNNIVWTLR